MMENQITTPAEYNPVDSPELARCLALHSQLAYRGHRKIADTLKEAGFARLFAFAAQGNNAFLSEFPVKNGANIWILTFRGTENDYKDILHDITIFKRTADYRHGYRVHGGFLTALQYVWGSWGQPCLSDPNDIYERVGPAGITDIISEQLKENDKLFVTGHSLGGALGYLAAYFIQRDLPVSVSGLFTFGAPRLLDTGMAKRLNSHRPFPAYRYVNAADIVPRVPLAIMGFRHAGEELYITTKGKQIADAGPAVKFKDIGYRKAILFLCVALVVYAAFGIVGSFENFWLNSITALVAGSLSLILLPYLFELMPFSFLSGIKFRAFTDHGIQNYIKNL